MIFIGYEPGSKGYQFWDAAHQCFEISCDVKFEDIQFPVKESKSTQSIPAPLSNCQIPESDNESDSSGLDPVNLAQPPTRPLFPGHTAPGPSSQSATPPSPPLPRAPRGLNTPLPDMETALSQPPVPQYSFRPTKGQEQQQPQAGTSTGNINKILIHMFQEVPNSYREAMSSPDKEKWLAASKEEFKGLTEMGVWKLVDRPVDRKTIKCRWTYVFKSDGRYKAQLVAKGYTQVQGIDYKETFSPVARYESIRYLLAHATLKDWEIEAMDVKLAFLHGVLEEEIYMEQPEGFVAQGEEDKVCKLVCSLYGLKQAGQVWNRTFAHTIKRKLGFTTIHSDEGVYVHTTPSP